MRAAVAVLVGVGSLSAQSASAPQTLVRESLANYLRDYRETARHYIYQERDEEKSGNATKVSVAQVVLVNGLPYERTVGRNGEPLSAEQESKEQTKLEKRRNEGSAERQKREREYTQAPDFLMEVPDAFTFTPLPDETVNGRPNYVLQCAPKPGYHAHNSRAAMFSHIRAKLWIDKQDLQWTKADAQVLDTISIGWILARIGPGAKISIQLARLNDRDWLPSLIDIDGDARILLVKDRGLHEKIRYSGFQPATSQTADASSQVLR